MVAIRQQKLNAFKTFDGPQKAKPQAAKQCKQKQKAANAEKPNFTQAAKTLQKAAATQNAAGAPGNGNQVLDTIAKSPTGLKLLQQAQQAGVKINFAPDKGDGVNGFYDPNNNSITVHAKDLETMTETLAHELYHAVTKGNGNSIEEEKAAFAIGEQVAGEAGVDANHRGTAFWDAHVERAYAGDGLARTNGTAAAMAQMGIAPAMQAAKAAPIQKAAAAPVATPTAPTGLPTGLPTGGALGGMDFNALLAWLANTLTGGRIGQDVANSLIGQQKQMPAMPGMF